MFEEMVKKAKLLWLTVLSWLLTAQVVFAESISEKTADEVNSKLFLLVQQYLMPFGATVIFGTIVYTGFKLIVTAHKPEERAKAMGSLPYIIAGGIIIGGGTLLTGLILHAGKQIGT